MIINNMMPTISVLLVLITSFMPALANSPIQEMTNDVECGGQKAIESFSNGSGDAAILTAQSGYTKIRNRAWGLCLNLQDHANRNGGLPNVWECVDHADQEWQIQHIRGGYVKIRNRAWGRCLNLQDHENRNGGRPNVWECVDHADQEWQIQRIRGGYVKIRNRAWGLCLNLQNNANKNGGVPNVWECVDHADQEWRMY